MMQLKSNVKFYDKYSAINIAVMVVNSIYQKHGIDCVITSANDLIHSKSSLHYSGLAYDFRIKNIPTDEQKELITKEIKEALTDDFDVVLESDHIHLEFDPPKTLIQKIKSIIHINS